MNILFFIPARGGSKGIPKKNLALICGCPLVAFPIILARKTQKYFDKYKTYIFVSTDSNEIADEAKKWGASVPFLRDKRISQDRSDIIDAILFSCEKLKKKKIFFPDIIILLQPTSPLTEEINVKEAFDLYLKNKRPIVSVTKYDHPLFWVFTLKDKYLKINSKVPHLRQTESKDYYRPNGAIYISSLKNLQKYKTFYEKKILPYIMPFHSSIDIDKIEDLFIAEKMLEYKREIKNNYIQIKDQRIGSNFPVFFIAEAGVNHNGKIELAKKLVDLAKEAGANCVKFQTFKAEKLASSQARKASYQLKTTSQDESQMKMLKNLELSEEETAELKEYCDKRNIIFLSTPFDLESLEFLEKLNVPAYKIGSGDITNYFLLKEAAKKEKPIILSTGMSYLYEVFEAINLIENFENKKIALLHCVSEYPAPLKEINFKTIKNLSLIFSCPVGFSDHTISEEASILSVGYGANIIEKHFTLDKNLEGPDHKSSMEPEELKELINKIRAIEKSLGDGIKKPALCEEENRILVRRSIFSNKNIKKGEIIKEENLIALRPGGGISPMEIETIMGKKAKRDIKEGEVLSFDLLED